MFQQTRRLDEDPILGVMAKFRADPNADKIDLGVGVYRDLSGNTPVLDCVRKAEQAILAGQTTKVYVAPAGRAEFNEAVMNLVLGAAHAVVKERRAFAVKDYLESHGVQAGILTAQGFGEDHPIADNKTAKGRAENRRVTVEFETTVTSR